MNPTDRPQRHRGLMTVLLVAALLLTLGAAVAIWLDRQALSNRGWTDTSARLLQNKQVRTAVADEIVVQLFARAHVDRELTSALGPLAPTAEQRLRSLAIRLAITTLQTEQVGRAWRVANSQAHRQLVADVEHDRDQGVYLQLTPIVNDLLDALRESAPIKALPSAVRQLLAQLQIGKAGRVRILRAGQVGTVRVAVNTIRNLVLVLSLLAGICFVLAILVATGRRARAIAYVGVCLAVCGGLLLAARALIGPALADSLVPASAPANRAAVRATWLIGSTQLQTAAIIALIAGGVLLIGGTAAAIESGRREPSRPVWQ
ncbi:MAG: hypothetical protein WAL22_19585 [Solirubrobacteraceae bacterium]